MYDLWLLSNQNAVTYWEIFKKKFPHAKRYILESSIEDGVVECARQSFTNMLYTVSDKLDIVDDWDFSFCPDSYENTYIHIWPTADNEFSLDSIVLWPRSLVLDDNADVDSLLSGDIKEHSDVFFKNKIYDVFYVGKDVAEYERLTARFPRVQQQETATYQQLSELSTTDMFWVVWGDLLIDDNFNFSYVVNPWDSNWIHVFKCNDAYDGVCLFQANGSVSEIEFSERLFSEKKEVDIVSSTYIPFDIFFISYEEETANENWKKFKIRFPHARRVNRIHGIHNAHKLCAALALGNMFYTVDADTIVDESWDFTFVPNPYDRKYLHLWYSLNPINSLSYGYGSIKLWPKHKVVEFESPFIDFTTGVGSIKIHNETIATTSFNTSEYSTWKSALYQGCNHCNKNRI